MDLEKTPYQLTTIERCLSALEKNKQQIAENISRKNAIQRELDEISEEIFTLRTQHSDISLKQDILKEKACILKGLEKLLTQKISSLSEHNENGQQITDMNSQRNEIKEKITAILEEINLHNLYLVNMPRLDVFESQIAVKKKSIEELSQKIADLHKEKIHIEKVYKLRITNARIIFDREFDFSK